MHQIWTVILSLVVCVLVLVVLVVVLASAAHIVIVLVIAWPMHGLYAALVAYVRRLAPRDSSSSSFIDIENSRRGQWRHSSSTARTHATRRGRRGL